MNRQISFVLIAVGVLLLVAYLISGWLGFLPATVATSPRQVTDVRYGSDYAVTRTFLCVEPSGAVARDWNFVDRWVKPQLTYDTYTVDGRVYNAFRSINDGSILPKGHVRFRKVVVNIGDGPTLEGHSYLNTRINGQKVSIERELLFVEFNGRLERQRRPLPACGTPRR